jgi:hypothetical protein
MHKTFRTVALFGSGFVLLSFSVLVVNQTAQVVQLAGTVNPTFGTATFWTLTAAYAALVGVPVVLVLRMPSPLVPPESEEGPAFAEHLERLRGRLARSPHLLGADLSGREGVERALRVLDAKADAVVREAASSVFIATAVSQSGRLDGLLVLAMQSRMVWRIAHLYHQRPTARDFAHLYANVAATTFVAGEIQDVDLGEQVEPILSAAVGALGASLPGLQVAGTVLANCVLDGSANAFLTLRVGMIAKRYCGSLAIGSKAALRRAATAEAAGLLGGIVAEGSARVSRAVWRVSADRVGAAVSGASGFAKDAGTRLLARVRSLRAQEV